MEILTTETDLIKKIKELENKVQYLTTVKAREEESITTTLVINDGTVDRILLGKLSST